MAAVAVRQFADRLTDAVESKRSQLVVGLDPVGARLPAGVDLEAFCCGIVDAVAEQAVAVKPQSAFFEAHGSAGVAVFERVCAYARAAGVLVIADAKRGDIGSTAQAYAEAFIPLADAVTVSPYLGRDSLEPFVAACRNEGAGIFCLVKTSNPGSGDVQDARLEDGRPLWQHVASLVRELGDAVVGDSGLSSVGAVLGATYPDELEAARRLLPRAPFLLPGVGAQGGRPEELAAAFSAGRASALVSASRSIIYASGGSDWQDAAAAEAERLARLVWSVSGA
jgi:orotidine-5'-phosphate decarboxylase